MRLKKEFDLNICDGMIIKYGTVNKIEPNVIYVKCKMWVTPEFDDNFQTYVNHFNGNFKKWLSKAISEGNVFSKKYIISFDINADNFVMGKSTFCTISFFLKQKSDKLIGIKEMKNIIISDFGFIFKRLKAEMNNNNFLVNRKK